ncbi:MAG: hypothetical protein WC800_08895 [Candidatus Nanopelagicaceae bacterium]|jgi:hypothetical protein
MSEGTSSPSLLDDIKVELDQIDALSTNEHAQRLEGVHRKLETALSTIEGL